MTSHGTSSTGRTSRQGSKITKCVACPTRDGVAIPRMKYGILKSSRNGLSYPWVCLCRIDGASVGDSFLVATEGRAGSFNPFPRRPCVWPHLTFAPTFALTLRLPQGLPLRLPSENLIFWGNLYVCPFSSILVASSGNWPISGESSSGRQPAGPLTPGSDNST